MKNPFTEKHARLVRVMTQVIPHAIARMGVNHFRDSFSKGRFNDPGSPKWAEVERRKPDSPWYGFKAGAKARKPGVKARRFKDETRRKNAKGNFSKARTTNAIMQVTGQLRDSVHASHISPTRVTFSSSLPYAALLNYGGQVSVFGKARRKMPKRQFLGPSRRLMAEVKKMINHEVLKALKA
jgi:phage gpG-like protein